MKGYKGMNADMTCRGMQYEVGKSYHVDGDIEPCRHGLHFCERLIDVLDYYEHKSGHRFFEVEAYGIVKTDGHKSAASDLRIIRELSDIEVNRIVYGNGNGDGNGYGNGNGWGNGDGNGYGDGDGNGDGNGNGWGYGDGWGYGYGDGNGDGNGNGWGYGDGNGNGYADIQSILLFA